MFVCLIGCVGCVVGLLGCALYEHVFLCVVCKYCLAWSLVVERLHNAQTMNQQTQVKNNK